MQIWSRPKWSQVITSLRKCTQGLAKRSRNEIQVFNLLLLASPFDQCFRLRAVSNFRGAPETYIFFLNFHCSPRVACPPRLAQRVYFARSLIFRRNLRLLAILLIPRAITKVEFKSKQISKSKDIRQFLACCLLEALFLTRKTIRLFVREKALQASKRGSSWAGISFRNTSDARSWLVFLPPKQNLHKRNFKQCEIGILNINDGLSSDTILLYF